MAKENACFTVDTEKCTGCGLCLNVCPGNMVGGKVLRMENGHPVMDKQNNYGWKGCWKCQHCLTVCPTGAVSIFGIKADELSPKPDPAVKDGLSDLMKYRRTCRDFQKKDVDPKTIDEILEAVWAVPSGSNNQNLEFSVVTSRASMEKLFHIVTGEVKQQDLFTENKEEDDFSALRIYDAPHLFIAHKAAGLRFKNGAYTEMAMATAYFELIANAYGLGTVISTYAAEQLSRNRKALEYLNIPKDHTFLAVVGFGYPKYQYARGAKKTRTTHKI